MIATSVPPAPVARGSAATDPAAASAATSPAANAPVVIGKITARHGVKGWIKVHSYTRPIQQILRYDRWALADRADSGEWRQVRVAAARQHGKKLLAKLDQIDDVEAVAGLIGKWVAISQTQLAPLPPGEYYWADLIGLLVVNQDGVELGRVDHLLETGANDVLAVRQAVAAEVADQSADSSIERLLPWSAAVVIEVDLATRRLRVAWHPSD